MSQNSPIEWTDATWNPTRGCTKVTPGCKHCYAETFAERWRGVPGHPYEQGFDLRLVPHKLAEPLHWRKPRRIFVNSMSDLFHKDVPNEYIAAVFGVMAAAPHHTFQVLTKRAVRMLGWFNWMSDFALEQRAIAQAPNKTLTATDAAYQAMLDNDETSAQQMKPRLDAAWRLARDDKLGWPLPNVHIGVSAEDQERWDERVPFLMDCPAAVRFVSVEPMLGSIVCIGVDELDWVICGGESGHGARPMDENWARDLRDDCARAGVPFMLKQLGGTRDKRGGALAILDGERHVEFPTGAPTP